MNLLFLKEISISETRQRKKFDEAKLLELQESIVHNGLLHPIVVRQSPDGTYQLVAGERRMRAIRAAHDLGEPIRCANTPAPAGTFPAITIGDLTPDQSYEAELEENIQRDDLTWQERAAATARLLELRTIQAKRTGSTPPTPATIAQEIMGSSAGAHSTNTRNEIILSKHLKDPDIAGAKTSREAFKVLKHKEARAKHAELSQKIGATFSSKDHTLLLGSCLDVIEGFPDAQFDCLLTDPPYGMGADEFGDSGGRLTGQHHYDDSYENWQVLMLDFVSELNRIMKPQSHAYVFCDFDRFHELKKMFEEEEWKVFRTPIIWKNPKAMRAPWPDQGPQRKYQLCLYAVRGNRVTNKLASDIIEYPSDENLGHSAQKPVELLRDLLSRTCRPGDSVLDAFCGSGSIFPACHSLTLKATGIEVDPAAHGLAAKRLSELK